MAIRDVEGSDFTKKVTGKEMVVYLMEHFKKSLPEALIIQSEQKSMFVRFDVVTGHDYETFCKLPHNIGTENEPI